MDTSRSRSATIAMVFIVVGPALAAIQGCGGNGQAVTPATLRAASERWEKAGVRDYDLEWSTAGMRTARYAVQVRDGQVERVEAVTPDGRRHKLKPAEPKFYGVDGLFLTIAAELAQLDQPRPFDQPRGTKAVLRFTPDPALGYPRRYRRDLMGASAPVAIDVDRLTPIARRDDRPSPTP